MKKKYILLLISACLALSSCLDQIPVEYVSGEGVVTDLKSAQVTLTGAYDAAQSFEALQVVTMNYASDNVLLYSAQAIVVPQFKAAGTAGWDPTDGGGFSTYYAGINQINTVLKYLPGITGDESKKNNLLGQAYFLRALAYFDLARTYGGVQLVLDPSESPDNAKGVKKSSYEDVLKRVKDDLTQAENLFDNGLETKAKASIWSVYALKARVCLYLEQWDEAAQYASKVIDSGKFTLTPDITSIYSAPLSSESIFELVFSSADRLPFFTYYLPSDKGGRLDYIPNPDLVAELLDPALGGKRAQLVRDKGDGVYVVEEYAKQDGSSSILVLRLAEQYLIRAEARLKGSAADITGAKSDINVIRSRAGLPDTNLSDAASLLRLIETERRYELAFEGHRFNDIVRTGRAAEVFGAFDPIFKDSKYWVLPFPNNAILADDDLEQNPGY